MCKCGNKHTINAVAALGLFSRGVNSVRTRNLLWGVKNKLIIFYLYIHLSYYIQ